MRRLATVLAIAVLTVSATAGPADAADLKVKARGGGGYGEYVDRNDGIAKFRACDTRADGKPIIVKARVSGATHRMKASGRGPCSVLLVNLMTRRVGLKVCKPRPGRNCTTWRYVRA
ncbi:MAG: hypothetical protein ACRDO7_15130 [Nocardioidaceae bacterium]